MLCFLGHILSKFSAVLVTSYVSFYRIYSCNVNLRDERGETPAMYACAAGHAAVLATLIDCGASTSLLDYNDSNALQHCFAKSPNLKCVKLAMGCQGDVKQPNSRRVTSLMLACGRAARRQTDIVRYLLDNGADPIRQVRKEQVFRIALDQIN